MINNISESVPSLAYWKCDKYPYYIPSIKSITKIVTPIVKDVKTSATSDKLFCVLKGSATYEIIGLKASENTICKLKTNDILFLSCGMQYYIVRETSEDYEYLDISFFLYTCNNIFTHDLALNFTEALNSPITHHRMALYLPRISHFEYGDEIHEHISLIMEYRHLTKAGYTIQIQTNLLQLILAILSKAEQNYNSILVNANLIGISSKFNQFTVMPKGCKFTISDVKIFDSNPHNSKAEKKPLSVYQANNSYKLNPKSDNLYLNSFYDESCKRSYAELNAKEETMYHIWIYPKTDVFTPDLRPYFKDSYLQFFAKSNMEIRFGLVLYNHDIHQCISHVFHILPSKKYTEYCVPLLGGEEQVNRSPHTHKIINYIMQNYQHKIRLNDIAEYVHMNASYISAKFKEETGVSISDYILDYRLSVAKSLLISSPDSSICEIALLAGFYDTAHFSKSFKNAFGVTAKEYRNQNSFTENLKNK